MTSGDLEKRVWAIRESYQNSHYNQVARESLVILEFAFRELYQRNLFLLAPNDRIRAQKAELQLGKGIKTVESFTLGEVVGLLRESDFFKSWSKATGKELRAIKMINLSHLVDTRNRIIHSMDEVSQPESDLIFNCLECVLETFGIISLEANTDHFVAKQRMAPKNNKSDKPLLFSYKPEGVYETGRLSIQAELTREADIHMLSEITSRDGQELRVLDIGCGTGAVTFDRFKGDEFGFVLGVDKSEKALDVAKSENSMGKINYEVVDVEDIDFSDKLESLTSKYGIEKFDLVTIFLVLNHIANPRRLLRTLRKFLNDGGAVLLRGSDDATYYGYPDLDGLIDQIQTLNAKYPIVGDRQNGRKFYSHLYDSGFRNISYFTNPRDIIGKTVEERETVFQMCYAWRRESIGSLLDNASDYPEIHEDYSNICRALDDLEILFGCESFFHAHADVGAIGFK